MTFKSVDFFLVSETIPLTPPFGYPIAMVTLYTILAIVGTGLAVLALLSGHGGDADHGHDVAHDFDHSADFDHGIDHGVSEPAAQPMGDVLHWIPILSLRFWIYFAAGFGLSGLGLTYATNLREPIIGGLAVLTGLIAGIAVSAMFRLGQKVVQGVATSNMSDLLGKEADVLVAVRPGQTGRVRAFVSGDLVDVLADLEGHLALEAGEKAIIVGYEGDRVRVMSCNLALEEHVSVGG